MANAFRVENYRSTKGLTFAVILVLGAQILCFAVNICFSFGHLLKPDLSIDMGDESLSVWLMLVGLIGIIEVLLFLAGIVVFLVWEHRSFSNLSPLRARNLEFSPGWSIGWWFIPFANLVKPYQAMKELWRESDPDYDEDLGFLSSSYAVPMIFGFWWAFWIISNMVDRIAGKAFDASNSGLSNAVVFLLILSSVLSIAAAGLLIFIVRDINQRQELRYIRVGSKINDEPPPPPTFGAQE